MKDMVARTSHNVPRMPCSTKTMAQAMGRLPEAMKQLLGAHHTDAGSPVSQLDTRVSQLETTVTRSAADAPCYQTRVS